MNEVDEWNPYDPACPPVMDQMEVLRREVDAFIAKMQELGVHGVAIMTFDEAKCSRAYWKGVGNVYAREGVVLRYQRDVARGEVQPE